MKILAIDFGEKRVGLAIGYSQNKMVFPLCGVSRVNNRSLLEKICQVVSEYGIEKILLGYPLNQDGTTSPICEKIDDLIRFMGKRLPIPVERVNEYLTSWEAEETLKSMKKNRGQRQKLADCFAAEAILRNYFGRK